MPTKTRPSFEITFVDLCKIDYNGCFDAGSFVIAADIPQISWSQFLAL